MLHSLFMAIDTHIIDLVLRGRVLCDAGLDTTVEFPIVEFPILIGENGHDISRFVPAEKQIEYKTPLPEDNSTAQDLRRRIEKKRNRISMEELLSTGELPIKRGDNVDIHYKLREYFAGYDVVHIDVLDGAGKVAARYFNSGFRPDAS